MYKILMPTSHRVESGKHTTRKQFHQLRKLIYSGTELASMEHAEHYWRLASRLALAHTHPSQSLRTTFRDPSPENTGRSA